MTETAYVYHKLQRKVYKEWTKLTLLPFFPCQLKEELSRIVGSLIKNYDPSNDDERNLQDAWDYVQTQVSHGMQQEADDAICQCSQWPLKLG